jgi:hypothetical protein
MAVGADNDAADLAGVEELVHLRVVGQDQAFFPEH